MWWIIVGLLAYYFINKNKISPSGPSERASLFPWIPRVSENESFQPEGPQEYLPVTPYVPSTPPPALPLIDSPIQQSGAPGTRSNPIPLINYITAIGGYGFDQRYGSPYVVPKGKVIWFKADPSMVPSMSIKGLWLHMLNFNPYTSRDNVIGTVYKINKSTGEETLKGDLTGGQVAYLIMPHDPNAYYLVSLSESGMNDQPMSLFWIGIPA